MLRNAIEDLEGLRGLHARVAKSLDLSAHIEAAHHSANRAGLLASGSFLAALSALQVEQAPGSERVELLRYATSERFFQWWAAHRP